MTEVWTADEVARVLRQPTSADDKYTRGVVGLRTGSDRFPGAAVLGVDAAWRTGVGMVRYVGPPRAADLVLQRRPETVCADGRVQVWVIGSGTDAADRTDEEASALRGVLAGGTPVVIDAGALDVAADSSAPRILTPHDGEHARLRQLLGLDPDADRAAAVVSTAAATGAVVMLKGARTLIADPGGVVRVVDVQTSRLATAGTGDVLAGVVGGLVAIAAGRGGGFGMPPSGPGAGSTAASETPADASALADLAAAAAWLHSRAGAAAVAARGGGPITALDVAEALPPLIGALGG